MPSDQETPQPHIEVPTDPQHNGSRRDNERQGKLVCLTALLLLVLGLLARPEVEGRHMAVDTGDVERHVHAVDRP